MTRRPAQRKFLVGSAVISLPEVIIAIERGDYLMVHRKPMHPAALSNWSLAMLRNYTAHGAIHRADLNPLYQPKARRSADSALRVPF